MDGIGQAQQGLDNLAGSIKEINELIRKLNNEKSDLNKIGKDSGLLMDDQSITDSLDSVNLMIKSLTELKNVKNIGEISSQFEKLNYEAENLVANINEIKAEASRSAIAHFDTANNPDGIKGRLNSYLKALGMSKTDRAGKEEDWISDKMKMLRQYVPFSYAEIMGAISNTHKLEKYMGSHTLAHTRDKIESGDLWEDEINKEAIKLGFNRDLVPTDAITALRENIRDTIKTINTYFPERKEEGFYKKLEKEHNEYYKELGFSDKEAFFKKYKEVSKRKDDGQALSDNDEYILSLYERVKSPGTNKEFYDSLIDSIKDDQKKISEIRSGIGMPTVGYIDMYHLGMGSEKAIKNNMDIIDVLNSPQFSNSDALIGALKEYNPYNTNPTEKLNDLVNEKELTEEIAKKRQEILDKVSSIKSKTKDNILSEKTTEQILESRRNMVEGISDALNKITSAKIIREEDKFIDKNNDIENIALRAYESNINDSVTKISEIKDKLIKAQNALNSPTGRFEGASLIKDFTYIQNLLSNGLYVNLEDNSDALKKLNLLKVEFELIQDIAKNIKLDNISEQLVVDTQILGRLEAFEKKVDGFKPRLEAIDYKNAWKKQLQAEYEKDKIQELINVYNNPKNRLYDTEKVKKYEAIQNDLTDIIIKSQEKKGSIKNKFDELGMRMPEVKEPSIDTEEFVLVPNINKQIGTKKDANGNIVAEYKKPYTNIEKQYNEGLIKYQKEQERLEKEEWNGIINYVKNWEIENDKKMPVDDKIKYYTEQLGKFQRGSDKYYSLKDLLNKANSEKYDADYNQLKKEVDAEEKRVKVQAKTEQEKEDALLQSRLDFFKVKELKGEHVSYDKQAKVFEEFAKNYTEGSEPWKKLMTLSKDAEVKWYKQIQSDYDKEEASKLNKEKLKKSQENQKLKDILEYVHKQEVLTGEKMPLEQQIEHYKNALNKFNSGSDEYLIVLGAMRDAQAKLRKEITDTINEQEKQKQLQEQQKLNEVRTHVQNAYLTTGLQMPYEQQVEYYTEALSRFEEGSESYLVVLGLLRRAQQDLTNETERNTKQQAQAHEEAVNKINQGINTVLNAVNNACNFIQSTVSRITNIIRTYLNIVKSIVQNTVKVIVLFKDSISRLLTLLGNFGNRVGILNNNSNILIGTFTTLRSKIQSITSAFNQLLNNQMFKKAQYLYQSVFSLKNIVGDELTQSTINWANNLEYAFGISAKGLLSDLNELSGVLYGLGMNKEDVAEGSKNILMLSRYLAFMGAAGGDVQQVTNKLVSGMKGLTASIDDLGLSVREDQMNAFLKDLQAGNTILNKKLEENGVDLSNMSTSFSGLNEQARVYIRYASLITQFDTKYNMVEFAGALETVTGRISIFKEAVSSLATTVGQVLVVAFSHVAKYLYFIVVTIEKLISRVFSMIGVMTELSTYMNDTEESKEIIDSLKEETEAIDELSRTAKRASKSMQGFDSVNSISTGSAGDFDYSQLMTTALEGLAELTAKYLGENKSYYEETEKQFNELIDKIRIKTPMVIQYIVAIARNLGETIIIAIDKIAPKLKGLYTNYLLPIINILTKPITDKLGLLNFDIQNFGKQLGLGMYDDEIDDWFENFEIWLMELTDKTDILVNNFVKKLGIAFRFLTGQQTLDDVISVNESSNGFKTLVDILSIIHDLAVSLIDIFKELGSGLITWIKTDGLNLIVDTLRWVSDFIANNKEAIVEIITRLGNFVADNFVIFLNEAKEALQWIIDNKDLFISIIDKIQEFINFIAEHTNLFVDLGLLKLFSGIVEIGAKLVGTIIGIVGVVNLLKGAFQGIATLLGGGAVSGGAIEAMMALKAGETVAGASVLTPTAGTLGAMAVENTLESSAYTAGTLKAGSGASSLGIFALLTAEIIMLKESIEGLFSSIRELGFYIGDFFADLTGKVDVNTSEIQESAARAVEVLIEEFGKDIPTTGINDAVESFKNNLEKTGTYTEKQIEENTKIFEHYINKYSENNLAMIAETESTFTSVGSKLEGWLGDLYSWWGDVINKIKGEADSIDTEVNIGLSYTPKSKTDFINGFAKGGIPRSGSIFMANENGSTELVGNFGGYSGVANNEMILTAMKDAIFEATANAILETNRANTGTVVNNHFCENGIIVGNQSALKQFANMISKMQSGNRNVTGDIGFSI